MARIYISIGSNINPYKNIKRAVKVLREQFGELLISPVYESKAVGFNGDNFLNLVVSANINIDIMCTNTMLHNIEDMFGKSRLETRFSAQVIDLDLLLYDDTIMHAQGFNIPRDEVTKNAFVLWPLSNIAPDVIHPELNLSITEIWKNFDKNCQSLWLIEIAL